MKGETVGDVAQTGAEELYGPNGLPSLVSGALIAGVTARAKRLAIARDLKANTITGLSKKDMHVAVREAVKEYA